MDRMTDVQSDRFPEMQPKRTARSGVNKAVRDIGSSPSSRSPLSVFVLLRSRPVAQNHIHDQTRPIPVKAMRRDTSVEPSHTPAIPQRWKRRRRSPFCSRVFWSGAEKTLGRRVRKARHHWRSVRKRAFCSWSGLKPQELRFTAKSLSRTKVTSVGY